MSRPTRRRSSRGVIWPLFLAGLLILGGLMMMGVFDRDSKEPATDAENAFWGEVITLFPDRDTALILGHGTCARFEAGLTIGEVWPLLRNFGLNEVQIDDFTIALEKLCPEEAEQADTVRN